MFKELHDIYFEELGEPYHFKIGMRMVKTAIAVFICALIGWWRGQTTIFGMIAAILCMQKSTEKAVSTSFNRLIGTAVGGIYGLLILFLETYVHTQVFMPLYYLIVSAMMMPIISTTIAIRRPSAAAFSCIVFLSTTIQHVGKTLPFDYTLNRLLDTIVGIVVALIVNLAIVNPEHRKKKRSARAAEKPVAEVIVTDSEEIHEVSLEVEPEEDLEDSETIEEKVEDK